MTIPEHHKLCLGVLAKIYQQELGAYDGYTNMTPDDLKAIEEAVESAEKLGLAVSVARLRAGLAIGTDEPCLASDDDATCQRCEGKGSIMAMCPDCRGEGEQ